MKQYKTIGLIGTDLFILVIPDGCTVSSPESRFDVIRAVSKENVEEYRNDPESIRDIWKDAVANDRTDDGLHEFFDSMLEECEEGTWPYYDGSFVDEASDEEKDRAAQWLKDNRGIDVGAWECSGFFSPETMDFDLVLCEPEVLEELKKR